MNDKKLEELHQYFTGYGSPHDELIIRLIKEYRLSIEEIYQHIEDKEELFKQNKRYREAIESVKNKLGTVQYREYQTVDFRHEIFSDLVEALESESNE